MPMKYGVNAKKLTLDPSLRDVVPAGQYGGLMGRVQDGYTTEADDVSGQVIKLGRIRKGEFMIDTRLATDGLGTSVTIKLGTQKLDGTADNDARFISATAFATANTILRTNVFAGFDWEAPEDLDVIATIGGATPTTGKKIASFLLVGRK